MNPALNQSKVEQPIEKEIFAISYSQLKNWLKCPHLHWLISIEKLLPYSSNEYTAYGKAAHFTTEKIVIENQLLVDFQEEKIYDFFLNVYKKEITSLEEVSTENIKYEMLQKFGFSAKEIFPKILPALQKKFGEFELVETESKLDELITFYENDEKEFRFRGFIDLVIKTQDGFYHIIDWKTTTSGWNRWARQDKKNIYQLVVYKYFWCLKNKIDPKLVKTHYFFLVTNSKNVLSLDVTSGPKRTQNVLTEIKNMLASAFERKIFLKKKSCQFCECEKYYNRVKNEEAE
jgi:hypothetical protein